MSKIHFKKTFTRSFPRLPVHNEVTEYLTSLNAVKHALLAGFGWNKTCTDPRLHLAACRRILSKVEADLVEKKKFHKEEQVVLKLQWEHLEELEKHFRENFVKLNAFVAGNRDKRERAKERLVEDVKTVKKLEEQIESLKQDYAVVEEIKVTVDKEIAAHILYLEYLSKVMDLSMEFKNPDSIIDRYESLMKTKAELGKRQAYALESLESSKRRLSKKNDENHLRILGLSNILATCVARYQMAVSNSLHWERIVNNIKNYSLAKFKEITEVKQCCRNTYVLMCRRKGEAPKIPEDKIERQLMYIKRTLKQLARVRTEAERLTQKTFSSMKVETSKLS